VRFWTNQHVEGVELDLSVVPAAVEPVEVRPAVDTEQDRLPVQDERCGPDAKRACSVRQTMIFDLFHNQFKY
jgi:hypothetical protein